MTTSPREATVFADALAQPAAERSAFLDRACAGEPALRARVEALLAASADAPAFIDQPAATRPVLASEETIGDTIGLPAVGQAKAGRYKLLQKIGEGGCGVVYMAEQEEPVRRRVALKVIKLGMDTKAVVARFEAERQALAMMDHPNIAKVHDGGATATGRPYFVMELVRGIPITRFCDDNKYPTKARLELFVRVCHAIQHAHQKGIIHRDIKPSNVLVTLHDEVAVPMVIDFGIAKATQGRLTDQTLFTAFEQMIGTPAYMAPEQAEYNALDVDTRSDIYSLGVLLYELLTGRPPFDPKAFAHASVEQIRRQIREEEPPRPSTRLGTLDKEERTTVAKVRGVAPDQLPSLLRGDLDWIVMKALEKDRVRRYQTANAFALDVQRYLSNEPVVARPPSTGYRLRKAYSRHRMAFVASGLVTASLVGGLTFSVASLLRETAARERAIAAELQERSGRERAERAEAAARSAANLARKSEEQAVTGRANAENFLSFVFTELGEELNDFGQMSVLQLASERAVAYYERMPVEMQTRETRAAHAFALAGVSAALGWFPPNTATSAFWTDESPARKRLETAMGMFEELRASGPLTPFMCVAYAGIAWATSDVLFEQDRVAAAMSTCERAEQVLRPALEDAEWGGWAQRALTKILAWRAYYLRSRGQRAEGVKELERALASAAEADRRAPITNRPGLRAAMVSIDLSVDLASVGKRDEARQILERCRAELRAFVEREPSLASARWYVAWTGQVAAGRAGRQWKFSDQIEDRKEALAEYDRLARITHDNSIFRRDHARLWRQSADESGYSWLFGEFDAAAADARQAVELLTVAWASPRARRELVSARLDLARIFAAMGRGDEARHQLDEAAKIEQRLAPTVPPSRTQPESGRESFHALRRLVDFHLLDWPAMQQSAESSVRRLAAGANGTAASGQASSTRREAHRDLVRAAFEMGDYTVARRELEAWAPLPRRESADIHARFTWLGDRLTRIHVLLRAGDSATARADLAAIWPEVEAVFTAGPDFLFNQVQTARALSIRAETEDTDASARRTWLVRAAGYLRPAAAAGRLTRYQREVLLAGVERQLAALPASADP